MAIPLNATLDKVCFEQSRENKRLSHERHESGKTCFEDYKDIDASRDRILRALDISKQYGLSKDSL